MDHDNDPDIPSARVVKGAAEPPPDVPLAQPKGLWVIFGIEMWERFSYYGMRALLVLYLAAKSHGDNPGFGWSESDASKLVAWYTGLVYLTPLLGGWIADRFLGTHRSVVIGGWIIAAGHFCLALAELFSQGGGATVTLETAPGQIFTFVGGLLLIIIGTGFFKPCSSAMVGQLYARNDPRRDSGFTIFYMGVNIGALLAPLIAGYLGEKVGWHWGFGSAGVGMLLGLFIYQKWRPRYLGNIGLPPNRQKQAQTSQDPEEVKRLEREQYERTRPLTRVDWDRMAVILILSVLATAFWIGFEQAATSLNLFAKNETDRVISGWEFPATWYQSVNSFSILVFAPVFAWLWVWLDRRGRQPSTPIKFSIGILLLSVGYVPMVLAGLEADGSGLAGPQWLLIMYVMHTLGELCLSPVGLSMVTKLSPARHVSLMMGLYYGTYAFSNLGAGYLAAFSGEFERGEVFSLFGGQADYFFFLLALPLGVGLLSLVLAPMIKRMMHGLH